MFFLNKLKYCFLLSAFNIIHSKQHCFKRILQLFKIPRKTILLGEYQWQKKILLSKKIFQLSWITKDLFCQMSKDSINKYSFPSESSKLSQENYLLVDPSKNPLQDHERRNCLSKWSSNSSKSFQLSSSQKNPQNLIQNKKKEIIFQNNYSSTIQNRTLSSLIPSKRILKLSKKKKSHKEIVFSNLSKCASIPFQDDSSSRIPPETGYRRGVYRFTVTASGEQPHRNQTCGVIHRLRGIQRPRGSSHHFVPRSLLPCISRLWDDESWDCVTMERKRWMKQP